MDIDSLDDFICNIKELMKSYFYPKEDVDDLIDTHKHEISDVNDLQTTLDGKSNYNHTHPVDDALKSNSTNPVQNKVIKTALDDKAEVLHSHATDTSISSTSTNPVQNKAIYTALQGKANTSHTHSEASASAAGFMSTTMFNKLKDIQEGANKITVDDKLSGNSTNPVQNKVIKTALDNKASLDIASAETKGLMSSELFRKLDGIADGAKARKRVPGLYIESPKDDTNQGLITINQGTRLKVCLYNPELRNIETEGWDDSLIISTGIHYTINGANRNIQSGSSFGVNLAKGTYDVHFIFGGSGNYYPLYRTIQLRVD